MRKMFSFAFILMVFAVMSCSVQGNDLNGKAGVNGYGEGTMVKAFYGKISVSGTAPNYYGTFNGKIEIENAAYEKQVIVHWAWADYGLEPVSEWYDLPATYEKSLDDNKELWSWTGETFYIPFRSSKHIVYAIKYVVNGQEYWDNNDGEDYGVAVGYGTGADPVALGKSVLILKKAALGGDETQSSFTAYIHARENESAQVNVVYSGDGWNTVHTGTANRAMYDLNEYIFTGHLAGQVSAIDMAVSYSVDGWTAWDNNFGDDYHIVAE